MFFYFCPIFINQAETSAGYCVSDAFRLLQRVTGRKVSHAGGGFRLAVHNKELFAGAGAAALAFLTPQSRRAALGLLAWQGAVFGAVYGVWIWKTRVFTREETDFIMEKVALFKQRFALGGA